jgi:3-methyl-2-oxobutanoate hydroxymethyltransferase
MSVQSAIRRKTAPDIRARKNGEPIVMLTSYHAHTAALVDRYCDVILVGDSLGNVMHGFETTVPVTLDMMILQGRAVMRGSQAALVVVDMPFGSYQGNSRLALESAVRIMKESGAHCVKMEGGEFVLESIKRILTAGIPVMGHLGLTPQSIYKFGTYVVRATEEDEAEQLVRDAMALQQCGCFAVVLEKIPAQLAERVANQLSIPVIGIGAGPGVDGQVLVTHDMLGINQQFSPRFLRLYAQLHTVIQQAFQKYIADVKSGEFPSEEESY